MLFSSFALFCSASSHFFHRYYFAGLEVSPNTRNIYILSNISNDTKKRYTHRGAEQSRAKQQQRFKNETSSNELLAGKFSLGRCRGNALGFAAKRAADVSPEVWVIFRIHSHPQAYTHTMASTCSLTHRIKIQPNELEEREGESG